MSFGAGGGGGQASRSQGYQYTRFPAEFLADAERIIGAPVTLDQLARGLAPGRGLFDPYTPPPPPSPGAPVQVSATYPVNSDAESHVSGIAASGAAANAPFPGGPETSSKRPSLAKAPTIDPAGPPDLYADVNPALVRAASPFVPRPDTPGIGGAFDGGVTGALRNVGIGAAPREYNAPTVGAAPTITAPTATAGMAEAAQSTMDPAQLAQLEQSIFSSRFDPQRREIQRQSEINDQALQARLANSGIAASAAGVGLQRRATREQEEQIGSAARQAATEATGTRLQYELSQKEQDTQRRQQAALQNAQNQQQTNLANAGFSLDAQKTNAANVLTGNVANADAYLKTLGINQQEAQNARSSLLTSLQLQETDLARLDARDREALTTVMDVWLKQLSAFGEIGKLSSTQELSSKKGTVNIGGSYGSN